MTIGTVLENNLKSKRLKRISRRSGTRRRKQDPYPRVVAGVHSEAVKVVELLSIFWLHGPEYLEIIFNYKITLFLLLTNR